MFVQLVQVVDPEELLGLRHALLGQDRGAGLLVHEVVAGRRLVAVLVLLLGALGEVRDDAVAAVVDVGVLLGRARDDERRAGLVDQDRVHLVDDRVDVAALDHVLELELHVVAQVVEAELVVRPVGDVAGVGLLALVVEQGVLDAADRQAQEPVDLAHPLGVAAGEVVVDRHDVDARGRSGRSGTRASSRRASCPRPSSSRRSCPGGGPCRRSAGRRRAASRARGRRPRGRRRRPPPASRRGPRRARPSGPPRGRPRGPWRSGPGTRPSSPRSSSSESAWIAGLEGVDRARPAAASFLMSRSCCVPKTLARTRSIMF